MEEGETREATHARISSSIRISRAPPAPLAPPPPRPEGAPGLPAWPWAWACRRSEQLVDEAIENLATTRRQQLDA
eukprot:scaffold75788_cov24-Phaeocystis_antarctica.AAC.1